jgi:hypothetical protein
METWRCPTCLTVLLESDAKRCPACQTKLRRRSQPIVLGETTHLDVRWTRPMERQMRGRRERGHWIAERPAPSPTPERFEWEAPVTDTCFGDIPRFDEPEPYPFFEEHGSSDEPEFAAALAGDVNSLVEGLHRKARDRRGWIVKSRRRSRV